MICVNEKCLFADNEIASISRDQLWHSFLRNLPFHGSTSRAKPHGCHKSCMAFTSNSNADIPKFAEFVRQRCFFKESTKLVVKMASATANVIISSYRRRGRARDALGFLEVALRGGMKPDMATLSAVLSACSALQNLSNGLQFHALAAKLGFTNDMFVGSSLVDFYAKTGKLNLARQVFDEIPKRNVVLWNAMLTGYARAGKMKDARQVFEEMPERDMVSCTALISGYARHGLFKDALNIFSEMLRDGVGVDEFAICSVVSACGSGGGGCIVLEQGKQVVLNWATCKRLGTCLTICLIAISSPGMP